MSRRTTVSQILALVAVMHFGFLPSRVVQGADQQANPAGPGGVEVRFSNGSIVVMTLVQDKIEVQTEYGPLTVPQKDVQEINFGVRTSEDDRRKIDTAIGALVSSSFNDREEAVKNLVALGPHSYRRLQNPASFKDPEAVSRAQSAVKNIRERFHPRLLRVREDDVVRTTRFTIVGHIVTPTIRAKAEEFGDLDLRPAKLLSIRTLSGQASKEVIVDAATYGNQGGNSWLDTGVRVEPHLGLKIAAAGQVDLWPQQPGQYLAGPDGQSSGAGGGPGAIIANNVKGMRMGGGGGGELIGRIGESGTPFLIGSRSAQIPKEPGKLYVQIVPSPWGNASSGEYKVYITVGTFGDDSD